MRTTTDPKHWRFVFTITDLGKLLGKSPVTLRGWERQGFISIPRDSSGDRKLSVDDIRNITKLVFEKKRINEWRHNIIMSVLTQLECVEWMNNNKRKKR